MSLARATRTNGANGLPGSRLEPHRACEHPTGRPRRNRSTRAQRARTHIIFDFDSPHKLTNMHFFGSG